MTAGAQIAEAWRVHRGGSRRLAERAAIDLLAQVQIRDPEHVAEAYPHELSGGMGQRVMIAMMLAPDPELLIADEPTSALDATVQAEILRLIEDLVSRRGMGLILISHDLPLVSHFCDRVAVMYAGRVVEELAAADLTRATTSVYTWPAGVPADAQPPAEATSRDAARSFMAGDMIEVDGLSVRFGRIEAVKSVSFSVARGESFGLVGESGSGKSTVLRAISGLNPLWTGRMSIDGQFLAPRRSKEFHRRVQMVFQDPYGSLHPRQTVDRLLSEPLLVHGMDNVERRILRGLNEVALPASVRFRYPHQLSGGQRQRVAIARALMAEPQVLLLDEPTSALDVSVQAEVLNLLADLQQAHGLTYILVSHNLAVVAHLCARIGVMQAGELVELLSADDLRAGRTRHPHTASLRELSIELEEPETSL